MDIRLNKLSIKRFRGLENFEITEIGENISILGANGTGKTSIMDAFIWVLFGKDHEGRLNYNLKTLDDNGNAIPRADINVAVELELSDGKNKDLLNLCRIYREDWVKPSRENEEVFKGNTTDYYINFVPVKKSEYDAKIKEILDENIFKTITNPLYFPSLPKEEQRKILFSMVTDITDEKIVEKNEQFRFILDEIHGTSLDNFKKQINAKKRELEKEIAQIPTAIDENKRGLSLKKDWDAIRKEIASLEKEIEEIDRQIADLSERSKEENRRKLDIQKQINEAEADILKLKTSEKQNILEDIDRKEREITKLQQIIKEAEEEYKRKKQRVEALEKEIEFYDKKINSLREQYKEIASEKFEISEDAFVCPTCLRPLDPDTAEMKMDEMSENFNKQKAKRLEENIEEGKKVSGKIKEINEEIKHIAIPELQTDNDLFRINTLKKEIEELKEKLENPRYTESILYKAHMEKLKGLQKELESVSLESVDELIDKKKEITSKIDALKLQLMEEEEGKKKIARIKELEEEKIILNQELTELEKKEFLVKEFEFTKNEECEKNINELFEKVKFKLFSQQVNGQIVPDCECTMNGVPFSTLSNAQRIFAGLDIIRAVSKHYQITAPIWIDNRESTTVIPEMKSQVINLYVDPNYETLTIK